MPYNSLTDRTDTTALIPEEVSREIIQTVPEQSIVMRFGRRLPPMSRAQQRMPVLSGLVSAYFVDGDTGLKQTSEMAWKNKFINAAELAVIVPIPEKVLDDVDYDLWAEIRPRIVEAFGVAFDQAVLYGTNKPTDWPEGIVPQALAVGHTVTRGSATDIYDELLDQGGIVDLVEVDGFTVTGHVGAIRLKAQLRGLRGTDGHPIFTRTPQASTMYELDGVGMDFPRNGAIDPDQSLLIAGDWSQLVYSMRQDLTYKILTEAVIQDNAGTIIYNLAQQDMVALRAVMRLGWQLPNPMNRINQNESTRFPFSVLLPAG